MGLTLQVLEDFGIAFEVETLAGGAWKRVPWKSVQEARPGELRITVHPGSYKSGEYRVEGDWSGASYLLAAGAVGREPVLVTGLRPDSLQGDRAILSILRGHGRVHRRARRRHSRESLEDARHHRGHGACPDLVPTVAMTAAYAEGETRMENIAHLRLKECDRISACAAELSRIGASVEEGADYLVVRGLAPDTPSIPEGTVFHAYNDHRIAMSASLLGLGRGQRVVVDDPAVVCKSFPEFWNVWSALA